MTRAELIQQILSKKSYLCVGLDTDVALIPQHLLSHADPVFEFNRQVIDATRDHCIAYKINTAFYEASGAKGWETMERTVEHIGSSHFTIADAKRGDIGNSSAQYAKAFFETLGFDAITVAPYMGEDSVRPFLEYKNKWTILLGLTSNPGAADFEMQKVTRQLDVLEEGMHIHQTESKYLYEAVLETAAGWAGAEKLMFVTGATQAAEFKRIRARVPEHFLLVPGVGAQGGSLAEVSELAMTKDCGLLVNASRAIIYAGKGEEFAEEAGRAAQLYQKEMKQFLAAK